MLATGSDAVAMLDTGDRLRAVLTGETLLRWVAAGGGDAHLQSIEALMPVAPTVIAPDTSVTDGVIAMGAAGVGALAITADGTTNGRLQAIVTPGDLTTCFGEQPTDDPPPHPTGQSVQELRRSISAPAP